MRMRIVLIWGSLGISCFAQERIVNIGVDVNREVGDLKPLWAWFGYDEPNYTYMPGGRKLLSEIAELSLGPVYVRTHNLMTSGDGVPSLKWGSTNMYTEDQHGNPVYSWRLVDSIFDTYVHRKMKPLAEIGFMPEALSSHPEPYKHDWDPANKNSVLFTGWAYPPGDYHKWSELIYRWVAHCVERYGKAEVETWYWELWNEPNIGYLQAEDRLKTYCMMYDFASAAVKRALPGGRIGGPHIAGVAGDFLRGFIMHCLHGVNDATGTHGAPLDFIAFHAKGAPEVVNGIVRMGMQNQLSTIDEDLKTISAIPEVKHLPLIIGESDPEGCAACGMNTHPANAYRNGTMYSSYTAASIARIYDMNDYYGTNIVGAVTWAFEFENQPWFYGFRDLATNGVDKPVLNVFRMLGMMQGRRLAVSGDLAYDFRAICDSGVRGSNDDISVLAARSRESITVLLWNYRDEDVQGDGSPVNVTIDNIPSNAAVVYHYRIDRAHSNAYEVWKEMGSPRHPTSGQILTLEKAGRLELLSAPVSVRIDHGQFRFETRLPRQAVSLLRVAMQ